MDIKKAIKVTTILILALLITICVMLCTSLVDDTADGRSLASVDYQALVSVTDAISESISLRDAALAAKISYKAMEEEGTISQSTATSYPTLDPTTFVTTETGSILAASSTGYHGTISIPSAGVYYAPLYRSSDETLIDVNIYATELLAWTGYLGIAGSTPIICGHNNIGVFGRLGNLSVGSYIYFDTSYGEFVYQVTGFTIGDLGADGNIYFDGTDLISYARGGGDSLILYTCYPFTSHPANQRYIVYATLVDGTTLS